jgi:exonuclease VII small subunit
VFFDVSVPSFETTLWTWRTLDQNDLGLESAIKELQTIVKGNVNAEQALKRVELQVNPVALTRQPVASGARNATGATASAPDVVARQPADPILADPDEAYRTEVLQALKEAMLDHSSSLGIGPNEWLTIAARGNNDRPRLAPADTSGRTRLIRLRGADLAAYLARQITKDEALQRMEVKVF